MSDTSQIEKYDAELVSIIKGFTLLGPLSWPNSVMRSFLKGVEQGIPKLPKFAYPKQDMYEQIETLRKYVASLGTDDHPAMVFLRETAQSYLDASMIVQGAGTQDVTEFSKHLYGSPQEILPGYGRNNVEVAKYFLNIVKKYRLNIEDEPLIYNAQQFKQKISKRVREAIDPKRDPIDVIIDSNVTARAAAGSNYIKLRKGARFSENDFDQLFHHEVMIHTLTYINGRKQPLLTSLGYNAPRTTGTQEGLAVFAEYINMAMDLVRLKRIALRVLAIDLAEQGADFIELFTFYRSHGQNAEESYYSAMRIFRGGNPKGGIIFYKDNVYLRGLIEVSGFFKRAMHKGTLHDIDVLFCGKLTTGDVWQLKPLIDTNQIADPAYMPSWAKRSGELAAHLAINDLTERFKPKVAKKLKT